MMDTRVAVRFVMTFRFSVLGCEYQDWRVIELASALPALDSSTKALYRDVEFGDTQVSDIGTQGR